MKILLIRHTTPAVAKGICYGQTDLELAETFPQEASLVKERLPFVPQMVYSSPLKRCKLLAEALFESNTIKFESKLMEMNFGDWEMRNWNDIDEVNLKHWTENFVEAQTPNGESFLQLQSRVRLFWERLLDENTEEKVQNPHIALITHAGVMRVLACEALGLPLKNAFRLELTYGKTALLAGKQPYINLQYWNL